MEPPWQSGVNLADGAPSTDLSSAGSGGWWTSDEGAGEGGDIP
jgi:hypothetical protein